LAEYLSTGEFELNTLDDVTDCLSTLEKRFIEAHDRRAIFATAYLTITEAMKGGLAAGRFGDNPWVAIYVRAFARLYVAAIYAYDQGDMENVPQAWRVAFDLCAAGDGLVIQHLVLGINAHVNHDLPFALVAVGIDPDRPGRYDDHTSVNVVLGAALDALQDHVERLYSPVLRLFDNLFGRLDDNMSFSMVKNARENAWHVCLELLEAQNDVDYKTAKRKVNKTAGELAEMIARPLQGVGSLLASLASLETRSPIWLLMKRSRPDIYALARAEILPSLDTLHDRLHRIVEKFDTRGSEMAVYPAFYEFWLHIFSSAVQEGKFSDVEWIVRLELRCASIFLRSLADFEAGQVYDIPHGWATALYAAYDREATIPQHMLLSINARMSQDLPMLLRSNGHAIAANRSRANDLEQWRRLYDTTIEAVGADLVRKYKRRAEVLGIEVEFPDRLLDLDFLDGLQSAAIDEANPTNMASEADLEEIAVGAAVRAHEILTRQHISSSVLTTALKQIEASYTGNWSNWI
jgi:hypothetical protein